MPEDPEPISESASELVEVGIAALEQEDYTTAIALFKRATQLDATYANAWTGVGSAAYKLHRYDDALAAFERAVACAPTKAKGWSNLYTALWQAGRTDESPWRAPAPICGPLQTTVF
jgi:tetratricopeptide (TPR) repeat protein